MDTTRLEVTPDRARDGDGRHFATPLPIRPGVGETIVHRSWAQARKAVLAALLDIPCVVVVAGAPGTGKTLLLADIVRALADAGAAPVLYRRGDLAEEPDAMPTERPAHNRIVLIDEADRISDAALARFATQPGLGLVLAQTDDPTGDTRFGALIGARRLSVVRLEPLTNDETRAFLAASLARAGRPADLIGDDVLARIALHSGGVPRLVTMLASAALFLAASEGSGKVAAQHVDDAAEMSGLIDHAEVDGLEADDEVLPSWETTPSADVPEIAPADLAAIAQSWADAAIGDAAPKRAATRPAAPSWTRAASDVHRSEGAVALEPLDPPLRATGDSRIGRPMASRAGRTRQRAAAVAAVLLVVSAGTAGWLALHNAKPAAVATAGPSTQGALPPAQPQVAVASPAATPSGTGRAVAPIAAPPVIEGTAHHGEAVSTPAAADPAAAPSGAPHEALTRQDAQTRPGAAEPDPAHPTPPAATLPPLHAPSGPPVARARAIARATPRSPQASEAEAGRPSRPWHPRAEPPAEADRQGGGILGVLREFSAREEPAAGRDPSGAADLGRAGQPSRKRQAEQPGGDYVGSYVMGPDGRRMFVQDP